MVTVEENKEVARRAFESLAAADLGPLGDLLAPDAVLHQCGFLEPVHARKVLESGLPGPRQLSERQVTLEHMVAEGDLVALHWRTSGRYSDPESPQHDGKHVSFPWMSFIRLEDGKIAEIWNIQDLWTLQAHLWEEVGTA